MRAVQPLADAVAEAALLNSTVWVIAACAGAVGIVSPAVARAVRSEGVWAWADAF
jgi:hypothetical protein